MRARLALRRRGTDTPATPAPSRDEGSSLMVLQRKAGNRAVSDLVGGKVPQMRPLTIGAVGQAVSEVQQKLNQAGAEPALAVDGQFGKGTLGAVKEFQSDSSLAVDGVVGPKTWAALGGHEPLELEEQTERRSGPDPAEAEAMADQLHAATAGLGTDEAAVAAVLEGKSPTERAAIAKAYTAKYGSRLDDDLRDDLSDDELDQVNDGNSPAQVAAAKLHAAMAGFGTDEDTVFAVLEGISAGERGAIAKAYTAAYGSNLDADLRDELSDDEYARVGGGGSKHIMGDQLEPERPRREYAF